MLRTCARSSSCIGDEDISVWNGDKKAATKVRDIEKADYDVLHKDYSESVDAVLMAICSPEEAGSQQAAGSLGTGLEVEKLIPAKAKHAIDAFLQNGQEPELDISAPDAHGYEFRSHRVIEMLEKLLNKFRGRARGSGEGGDEWQACLRHVEAGLDRTDRPMHHNVLEACICVGDVARVAVFASSRRARFGHWASSRTTLDEGLHEFRRPPCSLQAAV